MTKNILERENRRSKTKKGKKPAGKSAGKKIVGKANRKEPVKTKKPRGKVIVIDGIDGSGKQTQVKLLHQRLRQLGLPVEMMDFPRYQDNLLGGLLDELLHGKNKDGSNFVKLDPHIASVIYAADRFESLKTIMSWLIDGRTVIFDRYVSANMIHQGGKIKDPEERREFLEWLDRLEHGVFALPRPDIVVYLDLPVSVATRLKMEQRQKEGQGNGDLAETDIQYQLNSQLNAVELVHEKNLGCEWIRVNCAQGEDLRTIEDIHREILGHVGSLLGLDERISARA